ncbi:hypothetical protein ACSQ67_004513 [Phaseolus vulgaris]
MSLPTTTSGHSSLYSALTLPRTTQIHPTLFSSSTKFFSSRSPLYSGVSFCFSNTLLSRPLLFAVKASSGVGSEASKQESEEEEEPYEEYEVEIEQPFGIKFAKGRDGELTLMLSHQEDQLIRLEFSLLGINAVFGTEIWPAAEYGRTMYTIRQRIGPLLMKMQKRYGKSIDSGGELTEKEIIRAERNSGVISNRVREIQMLNASRKKEQKERREKDLREGLQLYKSGKYNEALEKFESILGSKPEPEETAVASYNVACCYSKLNQIQAALSSLEEALNSGFEDFKRLRTDPDLANARASEEFDPLLKRFDESFINENAINAIKSLFGFGKK